MQDIAFLAGRRNEELLRLPIFEDERKNFVLDEPKTNKQPVMEIVGFVDGMTRDFNHEGDDATKWREGDVVVEVKNRVYSIQSNPPLYDIIQLVTYIIATGSFAGDLVQILQNNPIPHSSPP